ncbi:transposase family protein [Novosphingobium sp. 1949]|uniref:Transposase family protein n=1 Tax=Novosphingobium organovorum TaxID=2930092 RepID=A0ABT0BE45_9SPHN|nr:transposase family protein [Novosphingobium organovorum]MCJ2183322.1 transposase family protein [Novosphingobium organovorum]
MSFEKFEPNTVVEINGVPYSPEGYLGGRLRFQHYVTGEYFQCIQHDGSKALPTNEDYQELLRTGKIILQRRKNGTPLQSAKEQAEWAIDQVEEMDPFAVRMAVQCTILDDHKVLKGDQAIARCLKIAWTKEHVQKYGPHDPPRTVRHYYANCGSPGARHPRDMMRFNGQDVSNVRADGLAQQLTWLCCLEGHKRGQKVRDIHARLHFRISQINQGNDPTTAAPRGRLKTPSERTVRRYFNRLKSSLTLPEIVEEQAKEQDWLGGGAPLTADCAMQRVIIDHTRLDVDAVCPKLEMVLGRPWLSIAIDVKTRAIVAWVISFFPPSTWTVGEVLRRAVLPKKPPPRMAEQYPVLVNLRGRFVEIIVDNAIEFRSHTMEAAAKSAGFSVRFCPVKRPRYRAIVERAIKTINDQICRNLPGRVLSLRDARRWGYDAEEQAVVMLDELEAFSNQVIANYNVEPHEGIGWRQPAMMFARDIDGEGVMNFTDFESFRRDTLEIVQKAQLSPSGIRAFGGLRYHDIDAVLELLNDLACLEPRRSMRDDATATVDFRFDPMDISRIYVWNRVTRKYVALKCSDERYADGMPLFLHEKIAKEARDQSRAFNTEEQRLLARGRTIQAVREAFTRVRKLNLASG